MNGIFIRSASGLTPADEAGREMLTGVAIGTMVSVSVSRPRNLKHHRKYWALCNAIGESIGLHREAISDVLKIKTGHCTTVQTKTETFKLPKSISWAKMDQSEFDKFFNDCCNIICEEWLPGIEPGGLRNEIEEMLGVAT